MRISDWSSDVCSSDLLSRFRNPVFHLAPPLQARSAGGSARCADFASTGVSPPGQVDVQPGSPPCGAFAVQHDDFSLSVAAGAYRTGAGYDRVAQRLAPLRRPGSVSGGLNLPLFALGFVAAS